jgi:Protein of unknown function (DUF1638)
MEGQMRLKLIACDVMHRELCAAIAQSPHRVDAEFVPKSLHDCGADSLRTRLQHSIDSVNPEEYEAVLLGYALCGASTIGLVARALPLIVPRAYDCITLLLGGCERYREYSSKNPGVHFRSTGWLERDQDVDAPGGLKIRSGSKCSLDELVERYGEDGGRYLYEQFSGRHDTYRQLTFIESGLEDGDDSERKARAEAAERGWQFDKVQSDPGMMERMLAGEWDSNEFLVVPAGHRVIPARGRQLLDSEACDE